MAIGIDFLQQHYAIYNADIPETPEIYWHKWLGDARAPYENHNDHILCAKATGVFPDDNPLLVTRLNEEVTCQECKEWLFS
jgi:hypothetical protein